MKTIGRQHHIHSLRS